MSSSIKITFSTATNQDSDLVTLVYIRLLLLHITFLVSIFDVKPSLEIDGVFLDLYKALDRVWHDGLFYKLKSNGIDGNLFKLIKSFLNRFQHIVLNGESSVWKSVTEGVLQGSVLDPLFLLIYINNLPLGLTTAVKLFADDTSLLFFFLVVNNSSVSVSNLNMNFMKIRDWDFNWKMLFNPHSTKQAKENVFSIKKKKKKKKNSLYSSLLTF